MICMNTNMYYCHSDQTRSVLSDKPPPPKLGCDKDKDDLILVTCCHIFLWALPETQRTQALDPWLKIWHLGSTTCIGIKFDHRLAIFASVTNLPVLEVCGGPKQCVTVLIFEAKNIDSRPREDLGAICVFLSFYKSGINIYATHFAVYFCGEIEQCTCVCWKICQTMQWIGLLFDLDENMCIAWVALSYIDHVVVIWSEYCDPV